jgi:hypothetical protein
VADVTWASAFVLTLVIEVPVWSVLLGRSGVPARRAVATAVLVNAVSHPVLWFVVRPGLAAVLPGDAGAWAALALGEVLVVVVEAVLAGWCTSLPVRPRVAIAVAANAASLGVGLVLAAM